MKKEVIGVLYTGKHIGKEEKIYLKEAKKRNIHLIMFNLLEKIDEKEFEEKIKKCKLILNNTAEDFALEFIKTIEELGKRVIDKSKVYYYTEDKWMLYLKCKEHKIPTLDTILLSENIAIARKELKDFGKWPVVLKRTIGTMGEYVEKADNIIEAEFMIKNFWEKGNEKLPIIAQEFAASNSYRVTCINGKIVQTALKRRTGNWKATGVYGKKFEKFLVDSELEKIVKKVLKVTKIKICGIDLLKKNSKWVVIDVNAEPALDFFDDEHSKMIGLVLDFVKKEAKNS